MMVLCFRQKATCTRYSIRAGRAAKFGLCTLLLFTVPSVLMLYALLVSEFGERRPQLTAVRNRPYPNARRLSPSGIRSGLCHAGLVFAVPAGAHIAHGQNGPAPCCGLMGRHAGVLPALQQPGDFTPQFFTAGQCPPLHGQPLLRPLPQVNEVCPLYQVAYLLRRVHQACARGVAVLLGDDLLIGAGIAGVELQVSGLVSQNEVRALLGLIVHKDTSAPGWQTPARRSPLPP